MKKNRYIIAVLALVIAIYVFDSYFLKPKSEEVKETLQVQQGMLQKYEQIVKGKGFSEDEIKAEIADIEGIEKRLIQERTGLLASARLQAEISGLTDKAGLRVLTIRPLNTVKAGNYSTLPIYYEGHGDIKQISDFLNLLESSSMLIRVDKVSLHIMNIQTPKELKFKIQLSGLVKL